MGVPKFYRWLSERYPCLSEVVREHQIPEFDNLYLDMNGIIHICSHPNDDDPHFRITEEKIFESIFHYLDFLFRMVQPRKVFFLAVDGVAPRAKMNQQRGRRFRAAKEAEMNDKRAKDRGEALPKEARFDSNCITPGTPFMVRLQSQLKYFIASKVSTDPLWQRVTVVLSGHETPGEGEHKIMDYIRYEKSKPGYDPNVRHCLYGLDADLIMLGLCSHDPHFSLLREEVRFGGKKSAKARRMPTPEETTFHLLHLSLLREYLDHEFESLRSHLPFPYDLEAIIDDWILLGFLVGNDFIPHLPHLHINKGALHELYDTYKATLPKLKGYINCGGTLVLDRFETFMKALAEREMERFDDIYSDAKWLEGKTATRNAAGRRTIGPTPGPANVFEMLSGFPEQEGSEKKAKGRKDDDDRLQQLIRLTDQYLDVNNASNGKEANGAPEETDDDLVPLEDEDSSEDCRNLTTTDSETCDERDDNYQMEFRQHKRDYYIQKMGYEQVDSGVLREQAEGYVRAIQWNLHYYYNGCVSWSWFYKHHYSPWITDIRDFASMKMTFERSKPFLPFEQLLAVLPAASKELLPLPLQGLMMNETSPIIDYFPPEFDSDLNGKQQEWEAVVLIPFIEEKRLLDAMAPIYSHLKPEEQARNTHGPMQIFTFSAESLGTYEAPAYFPTVVKNHAVLTGVLREEWDVPHEKLRKGLMDGVKLDVFFPGFPTLKHLPHTASIKKAEVRVFEQSSRGENMLLTLSRDLSVLKTSLSNEAKEWLGKEVWISWPHMTEAKVVELRDDKVSYSLRQDQTVMEETLEDGKAEFALHVKSIATRYKQRWGIEIGSVKALLFATPMTGRKYVCGREGRITLEKQWLRTPVAFALHTVVKDILVHADPTFTQFRSLGDLFPVGSTAFMLGHPNYGGMGKVVAVNKEHKGRVQLKFLSEEEPDFSNVRRAHRELSAQYFVGHRAAQQLGLRTLLFSRLTGTVFVSSAPRNVQAEHASLVNIGLGLKNNKRNEEVGGFTRRETKDSEWLYSQRVIDLLYNYMERFPEVFDFLCHGDNGKRDMFSVEDLFYGCDRPLDKLKELTTWLKDAPSASASRQTCGTETVEEEVVKMVEATVQSLAKKQKETTMQVKPHLLYKPDLHHGNTSPDDKAEFRLFDRVVSIKEGIAVPLGLKGTITGIQTPTDSNSAFSLEVLFDESFPGGLPIRSSPGRSYKVSSTALINISYGQRATTGKQAAPHAKPQQGQATPSKPAAKQKQQWPQQQTQDPTRSFNGQRQASERKPKSGQDPRGWRPEPRAAAGPFAAPPPTAILTRGHAARPQLQQPQLQQQQPLSLAQPPDPRQLPNPALFFPSAGGFRMGVRYAVPTGFQVPPPSHQPPNQPPHQPPPACLLPNPLQLFGASPNYRMPFPPQQSNNPAANDDQASFEELWSTMTQPQQKQ